MSSTSHSRHSRIRTALAAIVMFVASLLLPAAAATAVELGTRCRDVSIPIRFGQPSMPASIYGRLCLPAGRPPRTAQLLVHGAAYDHDFWDPPVGKGAYSYARVALVAGYATLAIDRIGSGRSTRPHSSLVTYDAQVSSLHQVAQALRSGALGAGFARVEYIGHSFGSAYGVGLAAAYPGDLDAVVLTGSGHRVSPAFSQLVAANYYPANNEPRFSGLDPGWLTSRPGSLPALHYYLPTVSPRVLDYDERTKQVVSATEFSTRPDLSMLMPRIHVPVLIITGQQDVHYCAKDNIDCSSQASFHQAEAPYFAPDACLSTWVVAATGHNLPLHYTGPFSALRIVAWSLRTVSVNGQGHALCAGP